MSTLVDWQIKAGDSESAALLPAIVPGVAQLTFPNQYGVFRYSTTLPAGKPSRGHERPILHFDSVIYRAEVYVDGKHVATHDGAEESFDCDLTGFLQPGREAQLTVRTINPEGRDHPVIGDLDYMQIPLRHRNAPINPGLDLNVSGITGEVRLDWLPAVRIVQLWARPDCATGDLAIEAVVQNDLKRPAALQAEFTSCLWKDGSDLRAAHLHRTVKPGRTTLRATLHYDAFRRWELDDPQLYAVRVRTAAGADLDERMARAGFRVFEVRNGFFRFNGRRVFLKCAHTGNMYPLGWCVPAGHPEFYRQDLVNAKAGGFNAVRFISGLATPEQLDLCDELGLMIYEENLAAWWFCKDPDPAHGVPAFNNSLRNMLLRDRNHPCVAIWGLLNENVSKLIFQTAHDCLPLLRSLDPTRLVLLSSGRWDCNPSIGSVSNPGSSVWEPVWGIEGPGAKGAFDGKDFNPNGGFYFSHSGDVHTYLMTPHTEADRAQLRSYGRPKPVFLSEYGVGSIFDVTSYTRDCEAMHANPALYDFELCRTQDERLRADWQRWGLDGVYPTVEDFQRDSARRAARERRRGFDIVRGNPWLCGWNITSLVDPLTGEGFWDMFRKWKPAHAEVLTQGWAPLRWCLNAAPWNQFSGKDHSIQFEAILANEDVLPPGSYSATLRITGAGKLWWSQTVEFVLPKDGPMGEPPLAFPVFNQKLPVDWPEGQYEFSAELAHGGFAADDAVTFYVTAPTPVAAPKEGHIYRIGTHLDSLDFQAPELAARKPGDAPAVIVAGTLPAENTAAQLKQLCDCAASGDVVLFLDPSVFLGHGARMAMGYYEFHDESGALGDPKMAFYPRSAGDFNAEMFGPLDFRFLGLPAGHYNVELGFAELWFHKPGCRIFDVTLNGTMVLKQLDVFAVTGGEFRPLIKSFPVQVGSDGAIRITVTSMSTLSRIRITDDQGKLIALDEPAMHSGCRSYPIPGPTEVYHFNDTLYHKECVAKPHPVFQKLPPPGIMDWDFYGPVLGHDVICLEHAPTEVMAAGLSTGFFITGGYKAGVMLAAQRLGRGWFYINTFTLNQPHPAARRLFANLLADALKRL